MKFSEFEELMKSLGITSLASMARKLNTTPQAVSNWKSRDQVPYHIVTKLNNGLSDFNLVSKSDNFVLNVQKPFNNFLEDDNLSIFDFLLILSKHIKIIFLTTFITVFFTFNYVQFFKTPSYQSWATVLLPENSSNNLGGLAGLASQFGVSIPMDMSSDLSSPSLYPELLKSRRFAEQIIDEEFFTNKYKKKLPLLAILTHGDKSPTSSRDTLISEAFEILNRKYLSFEQSTKSPVSVIKISAFEADFAKELANVILNQLENLNRYFKSQSVIEKNIFIENRIETVKIDLDKSEIAVKEFNERNRQISSPALQLELDRLEREVEVQKSIYLTLKQQLELAKIEEIQEASIVQILDRPTTPLYPSNKNLPSSLVFSTIVGLALGVIFSFIRYFTNTDENDNKEKFKKIKTFFVKNIRNLLFDLKISGTISILMLLALPLFLTYKSSNPVFFGLYSAKLFFINVIYILTLLFMSIISISLMFKKNKLK